METLAENGVCAPTEFLENFRELVRDKSIHARGASVTTENLNILDGLTTEAEILAEHQSEQFFRLVANTKKQAQHAEESKKSLVNSVRSIGIFALRNGEEHPELKPFVNDKGFRLNIMRELARQARRSARNLSVPDKQTAPHVWKSVRVHLTHPEEAKATVSNNQDLGLMFVRKAMQAPTHNQIQVRLEEYRKKLKELLDEFKDTPEINEAAVRLALLDRPGNPRKFLIDYAQTIREIDPEKDKGKVKIIKREAQRSKNNNQPKIETKITELKQDERFADQGIPNYVFKRSVIEHGSDPEAHLEEFLQLRPWTIEKFNELMSNPLYAGNITQRTMISVLENFADNPEKRLNYILLRRRFEKSKPWLIQFAVDTRRDYKSAASLIKRHGANKRRLCVLKRFRVLPPEVIDQACAYQNAEKRLDRILEDSIANILGSAETVFIGERRAAQLIALDDDKRAEKMKQFKEELAELKSQFSEMSDYVTTFAFQNSDKPSDFLYQASQSIEELQEDEAVTLLGGAFLTMAVTHYAEDPKAFLDISKSVYLNIVESSKNYLSLGMKAIKISILRNPEKATAVLDGLIAETDRRVALPENERKTYKEIAQEVVDSYLSNGLPKSK